MNFVVQLVFALFLCAMVAPSVGADEFIVGGSHPSGSIHVGDFACSGCAHEASNAYQLMMDSKQSGQVTAGDLWKFFRGQGISSVDHLTICLDISPSSDLTQFDLTEMQLMIADHNGSVVTSAGMGEDSLVVPDYEISQYKPEAMLTVSLGYDFMKRFSAESTERIQLNYNSENSSSIPAQFTVHGENSLLGDSFNYSLLFGFITFWVMVFVLLTRVTRPGGSSVQPESLVSKNNQVLST